MMTIQNETIARRYVDSVGAHDLAPLEDLFDDALVARFAGAESTKAEWLQALERLLPALVRNEVHEVFVSGDHACVIYDFVTDTPAGAVRCVELLTIEAGRIRDIELLLDRVAFAPVNATLAERAAAR